MKNLCKEVYYTFLFCNLLHFIIGDMINLYVLDDKYREQTMTQYENQMAAMRLEVRRLRNYDCYAKEVPHQELQTEVPTFCFG